MPPELAIRLLEPEDTQAFFELERKTAAKPWDKPRLLHYWNDPDCCIWVVRQAEPGSPPLGHMICELRHSALKVIRLEATDEPVAYDELVGAFTAHLRSSLPAMARECIRFTVDRDRFWLRKALEKQGWKETLLQPSGPRPYITFEYGTGIEAERIAHMHGKFRREHPELLVSEKEQLQVEAAERRAAHMAPDEFPVPLPLSPLEQRVADFNASWEAKIGAGLLDIAYSWDQQSRQAGGENARSPGYLLAMGAAIRANHINAHCNNGDDYRAGVLQAFADIVASRLLANSNEKIKLQILAAFNAACPNRLPPALRGKWCVSLRPQQEPSRQVYG